MQRKALGEELHCVQYGAGSLFRGSRESQAKRILQPLAPADQEAEEIA